MSSEAVVDDRLRYLEDGFKLYRTKMDSLCKEMKILVAEINIITEWIHGSFGIELINKKSFLYKHIHDYEDVQEISESLTMLAQQVTTRSTPITITTPSSSSSSSNMSNGALGIYNSVGPPPPRPPPPTTPRSSLIAIPISTITSSPNDHHSGHNHGVSHSQGHGQGHGHVQGQGQGLNNSNSTSIRNDGQQMQSPPTITYIIPHSPPPSTGRPPSPPTPTPRTLLRTGQGQCQGQPTHPASGHLTPNTPSRPPSLPPSIALFHPSPHSQNVNHQVIIHGSNSNQLQPQQGHTSGSTPTSPIRTTPASIPITLTLPRVPGPQSTLTISKKNKPEQETRSGQKKSTGMIPLSLTLLQPGTVSTPAPTPTPPIPITSIVVPLPTTPNYMPPKKIIRKNYQNQQQQLQQQSQADITKYFPRVVVSEQRSDPKVNVNVRLTPQSDADEEASQEQRQKAALQLLTLHNQLERRPVPTGTSGGETVTSEVISSRHHHHRYHHDPGVEEEDGEMEKVVEESEPLIDVGMEVEGLVVTEPPEVVAEVEVEVEDRPKKSSRKKLDFSKIVVEEGKLKEGKPGNAKEDTKTAAPGEKKRQSMEIDYSADADDEGISSDSTPVATSNSKPSKGQKDSNLTQKDKIGKKSAVAPVPPPSVPSKKRPRSRTPVVASKTTPQDVILEDGERPSTSSKLSCGDSGEEYESGSGKAPEKLPKRGRPKKKPEDRVRTYDPRVPMMCDECGKVLKGSGALRVHKQIHANIRPHECLECGKAFRRKHHLEFHMMIHAGDKKETCSYCGKAFLIRRDLARHERTHTGEKPYGCHLCPKSFNVKQHLTLHIRTHTGERPYRCPICDKTFTQANSLRIHKKIHVRDANAAANGTMPTPGGKKGVGSKGKNSSTAATTTPASASTSGISSAGTSALETPTPERIIGGGGGTGSRAPSRANSVISGSSEHQSHQSYHGSGRPFHSQSPSPNSCSSFTSTPATPRDQPHPNSHQYHLGGGGRAGVTVSYEHDHPPPVGETVVVVSSPLPPAHGGQGQGGGHCLNYGGHQDSPNYHHAYNSTYMNPSPWRLALNPGSGTNLLHSSSRSPSPQTGSSGHGGGMMPQPLPAHCSNTPITVIRPLTLSNRSGGGVGAGGHTVRAYHSPSPGSNNGFDQEGGRGGNNEEGRRSPGGRSTASSPSNQSFSVYDVQHVTRYY